MMSLICNGMYITIVCLDNAWFVYVVHNNTVNVMCFDGARHEM